MLDLSGGRTFRDLLDPISLETFVEEYWERRSLYIPGSPEKVGGLFDLDSFYRAVGDPRTGMTGRRPDLKAGYRDRDGEHREIVVQAHEVSAFIQAGMTIQAEWLEGFDPRLMALMSSARRDLAIAEMMEVGCFISGDRSGYGLHFDTTAMWVIQIEGQKRWWFGEEPGIQFPIQPLVAHEKERTERIHGLDQDRLKEQVLSPGDLLYLPAGTWHHVQAIGHSMHLCLTVCRQDLLAIFTSVLEPRLFEDVAWRHVPSPRRDPDPRRTLEAFFAERIRDLQKHIESLTPRELYEAWRGRPEESVEASEPIQILPSTVLERMRPMTIAIATEDREEQAIILDGSVVAARLPAHAKGFLQSIAERQRFTANDATSFSEDYAWEDVSGVLAVLVELGLIAPIS